MARRRTARKAREAKRPRTEPEAPRFLLSTLPFLVLMAALMVITVGIAAAAWPGGYSAPPAAPQLAERQQGTAPKGWFDEARKEFHR